MPGDQRKQISILPLINGLVAGSIPAGPTTLRPYCAPSRNPPVSYPDTPLAIWYNGMLAACDNIDKFSDAFVDVLAAAERYRLPHMIYRAGPGCSGNASR